MLHGVRVLEFRVWGSPFRVGGLNLKFHKILVPNERLKPDEVLSQLSGNIGFRFDEADTWQVLANELCKFLRTAEAL